MSLKSQCKSFKLKKIIILLTLIFNYTCYSQITDFAELNEKTVEEFLTNQEGFTLSDVKNNNGWKIYSSIKQTETALFTKKVYFINGYPLSYSFLFYQRFDKKNIFYNEFKFGLVESLLKDEIKSAKDRNFEIEKLTATEFKTKAITQNEVTFTEEAIIGENDDYYLINRKKEQVLDVGKYPMLFWDTEGSGASGPKIFKISTYSIDSMIDFFMKDLKLYIEEFKEKNIGKYDINKIISLSNSLDKMQVKSTFESMENSKLAVSYGMNDDKNILIKVNPVTWSTASNQKKWYIIYHELGHDILNLNHGEGDKMMFNFIDKKYTWGDFFEDRHKMFEIYSKKKFIKTNANYKVNALKRP